MSRTRSHKRPGGGEPGRRDPGLARRIRELISPRPSSRRSASTSTIRPSSSSGARSSGCSSDSSRVTAAGASDLRIMFRHVLPNTLAPVFVQVSLDLGVVIQIFAALIFIGFAPHGGYLPELGALIFYGFDAGATSYPWTILFPGLALVVFTVGINLLGDGLRDVLDPRLRRYMASFS